MPRAAHRSEQDPTSERILLDDPTGRVYRMNRVPQLPEPAGIFGGVKRLARKPARGIVEDALQRRQFGIDRCREDLAGRKRGSPNHQPSLGGLTDKLLPSLRSQLRSRGNGALV